MKRLLTSATMFLCSLLTFAQFSGSGSGTESDPYLILNPIQLNQMRNFNGNEHFKLMADIDLKEFIEDEYPKGGWLPIPRFSGVLDGNGKSISGLFIDRNEGVGLFKELTGKVKNMTLKNVNIKGTDQVGALAGEVFGASISDCQVDGTIIGENKVGGMIGCVSSQSYSESSFENLVGIVNVKGTGNYVGGILGKGYDGDASFKNSKVWESSVEGTDYVGGIAGSSGDIDMSSYEGVIKGHSNVGGLTGYSRCDISRSSTYGKIYASGDNVGGIVGYCFGYKFSQNWQSDKLYLNNCQFSGYLSGGNCVGGIVGYYTVRQDYNKTGINSCFTNADIIGNKNVGGICGNIYINPKDNGNSYIFLTNNVNVSTKIISKSNNVGLIYGGNLIEHLSISGNKYYNRAVIYCQENVIDAEDNENNGSGSGLTTLKLKATYVSLDWDFNDIWEIQETECYPYYKWQTVPPLITSQVISGATTVTGKCIDGGLISLEVGGETQQVVSSGNSFSFNVSPLQAGNEVRVYAQAEGKERSYYTTEMVAYLGSGTEDDPYQVFTAADLKGVYHKGFFKLMNDIDLTDYINQLSPTEGWLAIGRDGSETIHFDGNGNKITGLWCNTTRDNTGLFSCFANGTIKNLTVETANNKQVKGGANTGILIGKMINGTIENCKVSGTVADGTPVGGIVGLMVNGNISLSQSNVTINTTDKKTFVGGLAGEITGGTIDQCVTTGTYTASGKESYVGGLIGKNSATITNCYSNATITSSYNSAGIAAYNYGLVEKCYATGNINSSNYGAGVIGYNDGGNAIVRNCVAMNNKIVVTYESQSAQGGGYGQRIIGGFKNGAPTPEMNNYALKNMQVSLNNVPQKVYDDIMNGTAKTGEELVLGTTYQELGWDFDNVWSIAELDHYPALKKNIATVGKPSDAVTLTAKSYTRVYGEANPTFDYTSEGATLNGTPTIICDATATSPVGTYTITIAKGNVTNEDVTLINGTLTITKAPLTIKAGEYTKKQGEDNPTFVATYEGFKNNETETVLDKKPIFSCDATKDSSVGEYEITVSGAEATNYEMTYVKGKLTITEAPVTITANSYSRAYGDANPAFGYTSEGGTLNGTPTITCDATATSPVGTYTITIAKGDVTNEDVTLVNGTLTITKAPLTIKAGEYTKKQGEDNPTFVATYEGFKNNETEAVLDKKPVFSCEATKDSPVGEYIVMVSSAEATNYAMTYINGKLNIEPLLFVARSEDGNNAATYQVTTQVSDSTPTLTIVDDTNVSGEFTIPETVEYNGTTYKVTKIGESAFEGNTSLTKITIPSSVKEIGYNAFKGCSNLESITTYNETPINLSGSAGTRGMTTRADGSSVFEGVNKATCILYVPEGCVDLYKAAPVWSEFQNILAIGSSGINGVIMNGEPQDIYDLQGRKVKAKTTTLEGLPRGIYIINGKKTTLK